MKREILSIFLVGLMLLSVLSLVTGTAVAAQSGWRIENVGVPARIPTTLTATANPTTIAVNRPFTVNGTLTSSRGMPTLATSTGTPISDATVQLQKNISGVWTDVTGKTNNTTATGAYRISASEPLAGTYQYRTTYAGNIPYAGNNSTSVSVKVVSKASVLQDLATLKTTLIKLPGSAFIPGTKIAALAVINAADINVRVGSYGGATTTLKTSLLARTDGCAKGGKPDSDDWVRTCAAQRVLYPQVQQVIQEIQALQGS